MNSESICAADSWILRAVYLFENKNNMDYKRLLSEMLHTWFSPWSSLKLYSKSFTSILIFQNYVPEDVLQLSPGQMPALVSYIVAEAKCSEPSQAPGLMDHRIRLLHRCCCNKRHLVRAVVNYLMDFWIKCMLALWSFVSGDLCRKEAIWEWLCDNSLGCTCNGLMGNDSIKPYQILIHAH